MQFRQTPEGKNVFISIDSRLSNHNPLYKAWKTKSFTDGDITLHFILFDILFDPSIEMSFSEITDQIDERLSRFSELRMFAESTVRKRLWYGDSIFECKRFYIPGTKQNGFRRTKVTFTESL